MEYDRTDNFSYECERKRKSSSLSTGRLEFYSYAIQKTCASRQTGSSIEGPLKPPCTILTEGFEWVLSGVSMMPRGAGLSGSFTPDRCSNSQNGLRCSPAQKCFFFWSNSTKSGLLCFPLFRFVFRKRNSVSVLR